MVKGERTQDNVVRFRRIPFEQIRAKEIDLRVNRAQSSRNFNGRRLLIDRVNVNGKILSAGMIDDQAWDVAWAGGYVQNSRFAIWLEPASQKMSHQAMATKPPM